MSRLDDLKAQYGDTSRPLTPEEEAQRAEWEQVATEAMEEAVRLFPPIDNKMERWADALREQFNIRHGA